MILKEMFYEVKYFFKNSKKCVLPVPGMVTGTITQTVYDFAYFIGLFALT